MRGVLRMPQFHDTKVRFSGLYKKGQKIEKITFKKLYYKIKYLNIIKI